jgi:hypothetical protein
MAGFSGEVEALYLLVHGEKMPLDHRKHLLAVKDALRLADNDALFLFFVVEHGLLGRVGDLVGKFAEIGAKADVSLKALCAEYAKVAEVHKKQVVAAEAEFRKRLELVYVEHSKSKLDEKFNTISIQVSRNLIQAVKVRRSSDLMLSCGLNAAIMASLLWYATYKNAFVWVALIGAVVSVLPWAWKFFRTEK